VAAHPVGDNDQTEGLVNGETVFVGSSAAALVCNAERGKHRALYRRDSVASTAIAVDEATKPRRRFRGAAASRLRAVA